MEFFMERKRADDFSDEVISFRGEVLSSDIMRLQLTAIDRALLNDVGGDQKATPSDLLLTLEMLFRRHEEQASNEPANRRAPLLRASG